MFYNLQSAVCSLRSAVRSLQSFIPLSLRAKYEFWKFETSLLTEIKGCVFELSLYVTKYRKQGGQRLQNFQDNVGDRSYGSTLKSPYTPFTLS